MLPKIIIHNSVSLDGSLTNFQPNMELHYQIAGSFEPDVHLIGSRTVKVGVELYGEKGSPEKKEDFQKPLRNKESPFWVIVDTSGLLKGLLHMCRRFEFCKDVIVLISKKTPDEYVNYLKERNYSYHVIGESHVDLEESIKLLASKYRVTKILVDTGRVLSNLLLSKGLAHEISLLIHPVIVGNNGYNIFGKINNAVNLKLKNKELFDKEYVWLVYEVRN